MLTFKVAFIWVIFTQLFFISFSFRWIVVIALWVCFVSIVISFIAITFISFVSIAFIIIVAFLSLLMILIMLFCSTNLGIVCVWLISCAIVTWVISISLVIIIIFVPFSCYNPHAISTTISIALVSPPSSIITTLASFISWYSFIFSDGFTYRLY